MKLIVLLSVLFWGLMLSACASAGNSALLGASLGLSAGTATGLMSYGGREGQFTARNAIVGGALGGLIGAGLGYLTHELMQKSEKDGLDKGKEVAAKTPVISNIGANLSKPVLIPAKVESRFVDEAVRGGVFVPAHIEYIIIEPARWSR